MLLSAVLGRLEERGLSVAPDLEEGRLEGSGESVRSRSTWLEAPGWGGGRDRGGWIRLVSPDPACQLGHKSINNTLAGEGFINASLKKGLDHI